MKWDQKSLHMDDLLTGTYEDTKPMVDKNDPSYGKQIKQWIQVGPMTEIEIETKIVDFKRND